MARYLQLWLPLALGSVLGSVLVLYVSRHADLRYHTFAGVVAAPALQALALVWLAHGRIAHLIDAFGAVWRSRLARPVVLLDAAILGLGWWLGRHYLVGLGAPGGIQPAWIGTKLAAGAVVMLALGAGRPSGRRALLPVAAAFIGALAVEPFWPWLHEVADRILVEQALAARWLVVYGSIVGLSLAGTVAVARIYRTQSRAAALLVEAAGVVLLAVVHVAVLNFYLRTFIPPVWLGSLRAGGSVAASLLLVGSLVMMTSSSLRGTER